MVPILISGEAIWIHFTALLIAEHPALCPVHLLAGEFGLMVKGYRADLSGRDIVII